MIKIIMWDTFEKHNKTLIMECCVTSGVTFSDNGFWGKNVIGIWL